MKARRILLMACCLAVLSANAVLGQKVDKKRLKDISFDDVKFDIVKGAPFKRSMLTKEIEAMDGQLIRGGSDIRLYYCRDARFLISILFSASASRGRHFYSLGIQRT